MTEKQEEILKTALALFAVEGYDNTSTSKIAKKAGVSEGLIFRHFKNKDGLLKAILEQGQEKAQAYFVPLTKLKNPKAVINEILGIPFNIDSTDYAFWRLLYSLKWQQRSYNGEALDLLRQISTNAFRELEYPNPKAEAMVLEIFMDGAVTALLLKDNIENKQELLEIIKNKYDLGNNALNNK